ncbi:GNAT family N-acetyltransferase [Legionella longbeachae]|uniref:Putative GNAT family acetyltransferase n=1 Tax=Legionella longbeachae serogroup 1 (strain NSW150) TaxID=661367 RepID=D3HMY4_LEGLN|nr:GNAT family N-acetyltransferase [Legionella longbeachae]VEE04350.1 GNAT family acetyltransferase [Legionella oakridgensis]HBD7397102.1 GNAT family N-acetyltransferase [Legionella pneumophila]ARB92827.1 GNAT family N-acetyltransferase [Legionella longbeachae]ARM34008.1 GNAT family N-acetyltransferase [Legionella longbeachae]EEZ96773.1 acetyltransferase GNAT family protein [Legionella longbeachae D-4968]
MSLFLETKNLIIKAPQLADFNNLYTLQTDADVMKYIGQGIRTEAEIMAGLEKAIAHYEKYGFSLGCVFEKESAHFVGRAGLIYAAYNDSQPDIEVAYALHKTAWNKGYGLELAKALITWGFQNISIERLVAYVHPGNERSRRVLEKAGMSYAGLGRYGNTEVAWYSIANLSAVHDKIELIPATLEDYPVVQNLGRFYVYDMSEYIGDEEGWEIPADGLYECIDFRKYWEDKNSFPFIIRYKKELAGFAIVDKIGSDAGVEFNMAQFFIARKFKNKGIGRYVAEQCFKKFSGEWEVMVLPGNEGAYQFWRSTIKQYSKNNFTEYTREILHLNNSKKNIFRFNSSILGTGL